VLDLLRAAPRPIGAYALLEHLRTTHPHAAPPTVYRALAFLLDEGLVHRIERLNAFIAAGEQWATPRAAGKVQFLICDRCGHTAQLHDPTVVDALSLVMDRLGFVARDATIEVQGVCATCCIADTASAARPPTP
jgi:Fur family zinc uptake transcriptional regulator